jgi:hypothetical protein
MVVMSSDSMTEMHVYEAHMLGVYFGSELVSSVAKHGTEQTDYCSKHLLK